MTALGAAAVSAEERRMLREVAREFFDREWPIDAARSHDAGGDLPARLWAGVQGNGWPRIAIPEGLGGEGGGFGEVAIVVAAAAHALAPIPLAETAGLATFLRLLAGNERRDGCASTVAPVRRDEAGALRLSGSTGSRRLSGRVTGVPWGGQAQELVALATHDDRPWIVFADLTGDGVSVERASNMAGEPRDTLTLDSVPAVDASAAPDGVFDELYARAAALRAVALTGALERALALSLGYARDRRQFERPISSFQVIQHYLAEMAAEVAGARASVAGAVAEIESAMAADATDEFQPSTHAEIAAAKVWTGRAAGTVARLAHQIHGAIGVTEEHELHLTTRRLWSWRDEFGSEHDWAERLGAPAGGRSDPWELVTTTAATADALADALGGGA